MSIPCFSYGSSPRVSNVYQEVKEWSEIGSTTTTWKILNIFQLKNEILWKETKETCPPDATYSCRHLQNSPKFLQGKIHLTFKECLKYVFYSGALEWYSLTPLIQHFLPGTCPMSYPPFNPKNHAKTAMSGIIKQTSGQKGMQHF